MDIRDKELREEGNILLNNARKAWCIAEPLINSYLTDESKIEDINWGSYLLQQSIELSIKGLIKYYYSDFYSGHKVKDNIEILRDLSNAYPALDRLSNVFDSLDSPFSCTLYRWESKGRYKNVYIHKNQITRAIDIINDLLSYINIYCQEDE